MPVNRTFILFLAAVSLAGLAAPQSALAAISCAQEVNHLRGDWVVTNFPEVAPEVSPSDRGAAWTSAAPDQRSSFTQLALKEVQSQNNDVQADVFLSEVASRPPDDTPTGARVPEPATLVFVGTGLLAIARASRTNGLRRTSAHVDAPRVPCALRN